MTSPAVFKPSDKGVTSKSTKPCTCEDPSPVRMAACTAAPKIVSSDDRIVRGSAVAGGSTVASSANSVWWITAGAPSLLLLPVLLFQCLPWESGIRRARRLRCFLCFPSPFSPFLFLRPFLSRAFPARLSWLLAILFDGLAPSVSVGRCPYDHVMCLFDTSFSSCIEFVSFCSSTHFSCVVIASSLSCPSWASICSS